MTGLILWHWTKTQAAGTLPALILFLERLLSFHSQNAEKAKEVFLHVPYGK